MCSDMSSVVYLILKCLVFSSVSSLQPRQKNPWSTCQPSLSSQCGDDGHESFRLPGGIVRPWKTTARQTLDHCPAIIESRLQPSPPRSPSTTVPPGQAQDAWRFCPCSEFARVFSIALWLCVGGEELGCFATCQGEVFRLLGETEVADAATVYKIEMVAKAIARETPACTERSVQCTAVKCVCLYADNGADDVRAKLDDRSVLVD
jgi:hypothetical protein